MSGDRVFPAFVLARKGDLPRLEPVRIEAPGPGEVEIRLVASGLCHTDRGAVRDGRVFPLVLGHEGAGVVEAVGAGVAHVVPGDHVVVNWQPKCGACRRCLQGRAAQCEAIAATAAPRLHRASGEPLAPFLNAGTFCPRAIVPAAGAVPIPRALPLAAAALLGCAVGTGVGAALRTAAIDPGDSVVVIGAGGVGLFVVQGARLAGAGPIVAIDRAPERRALALALGATHAFADTGPDTTEELRRLLAGRGADHVFEVVGEPALMQAGLELLGRGGALTLLGAAARDAALSFAPRAFMSRQQTIRGCIYGDVRPTHDLPLYARWALEGRLALADLPLRRARLEELPAIFAAPEPAGFVRTVIQLEDVVEEVAA